MAKSGKGNAYERVIVRVFKKYYRPRSRSIEFSRTDLHEAAEYLALEIRNYGDLLYSFRFRCELPEVIRKTAPKGQEWVIRLAGRAKYRFALSKFARIVPSPGRYEIKIPDSTPEIISRYAVEDEQALLAKVRYNRLIDIFLGITTYSLQNHLRTTIPDIGQVETDEIYVGVAKSGEQFIIPVQAKGGNDKLGVVQIEQDALLCRHKYPNLTPKLVAVQFQRGERNVIAMFDLMISEDDLHVLDEKHYRLVPYSDITADDFHQMRN
jgi:hypothetical protein